MNEIDALRRLTAATLQPAGYKAVHADLLRLDGDMRRRDPARAAEALRAVMAELRDGFDARQGRVALPPTVTALYERELDRIGRQLREFDAAYFSFAHDPFVKDFALLTHRFIPVGAEFVSLDSGVPRRALSAGGAMQALRAAWFIVVKAGGFSPYFQLHAHPLSLTDFNPAGWERTYGRLADLLRVNPSMKGVVSASWFFDPRLRLISPHLNYLRDVPEHHGAAFFFVGEDVVGDSGAVATSKTRRRLFESGEYVPKIFLRVWPRAAIMRAWPGAAGAPP